MTKTTSPNVSAPVNGADERELLPCPFCAGAAILSEWEVVDATQWAAVVKCVDCYAQSDEGHAGNRLGCLDAENGLHRTRAAIAWNRRASLGAAPAPALPYTLTAWCCEKGQSENVPVCKECAEACAGYSASATKVPAAWQERQRTLEGWTNWYDAKASTAAGKGPCLSEVIGGIEYQWRPLFAEPTAGAAQVPSLSDMRKLIAGYFEEKRDVEAAINLLSDFHKLMSGEAAALSQQGDAKPSQQGTKS